MARVHEIGIGADTRAFEDQIKRGVIDPTEQAEKALKELGDTDAGRDAARDLERIEDALDDGVIDPAKKAEKALKEVGDTDAGKDAAKDLDRLEDALKDAQKQSEKTERAMDDIGDGGSKNFGKIGGAAQEVTQEVGQNLGEAVSSIRGDLSDLGQVGQDTLGGLAATIAGSGPAGIAGAAALAAGAVGLGLITAEIEAQNERVQQLREYFAEAWKEAIEGGKEYIDQATIIGEMQSIMFDTDRADEYKRIQEDANRLSMDRNTLLRAAAGDQDALNAVIDRANQLYDEQNDLVTDSEDIRTKGRGPKEAAAAKELEDLSNINDRWREYGDIYDENKQKAKDAQQATTDYLLATLGNAASATVEVDKFGNKLYTLPDEEQVLINAKTGQATKDIDKFEGDADGVIDRLNAKDITLAVNAAVQDAQNTVNNFIATNNGRSFKIHGRFSVDSGGGRYLP